MQNENKTFKCKEFLKKKLVPFVLVGVMSTVAIGTLVGCTQTKEPENERPGYEDVLPDDGKEDEPGIDNPGTGTENPGDNGNENPGVENPGENENENENENPAVEQVVVSDVINALFGQEDYKAIFNEVIVNIIAGSFNLNKVQDFSVKEFNVNTSGNVVIEVKYVNSGESKTATLEYVGDTTGFDTFYGLAQDKEAFIEDMLADLGLTTTSKIEKHSVAHVEIIAQANEFDTQKTAFESLTFTKQLEQEQEKPPVVEPEYVTVQSMVDQVFAGIDFDADLKATAIKLLATQSSSMTLTKLIGIDFSTSKSDFYIEMKTSNNYTYVRKFSLGISVEEGEYFAMAKDLDTYLESKLSADMLTLESQIDKNSADYTTLFANLQSIKTNYQTQKASIESATKSEITGSVVCNPKMFTTEELQTLGITDTNAFANALLNNSNGSGYDQVAGWTASDVITTYVTEFGTEGVSYDSAASIYVVTKNGVYDYRINTTRYYGATENRYSMILDDSIKSSIISADKNVDFSQNAIMFGEMEIE